MNGQFFSKQQAASSKQQAASSKQQAARIEYIDLLRSFGIVVMIMGHVGFSSFFDKWIHIFHMPIFFIISGYFYKPVSFSVMLKKRAKTLLVPYLCFGTLHLVIWFIMQGKIDSHSIYLFLWENTGCIPIAGALWFLTAMFFAEIVFWFIQQMQLYDVWKTVIAGIVVVLGMAYATYIPYRLPLALDVSMVAVGLLQIGFLAKKYCKRLLEMNFFTSIIGIIIFSIIGMLNGYINLREGSYAIWPLFWIDAVGMTFFLWNFIRYVYDWCKQIEMLKRPLTWINSVGRESIIFLCLNQLAILLASKLMDLCLPEMHSILLFCKQLIILAIAMFECFVAQKIIVKTKLRVIIGKF